MDLTWSTIEDLARTSDDAAVRRRFSERNRVWLRVLLIFFTFVSFISAVSDKHPKDVFDVLTSVGNLALTAFGLFFLRYAYRQTDDATPATNLSTIDRAARWLRMHMHAASLTYVAVQFALLLVFTRNDRSWFTWAVSMPLLMLGFRMPIAELLLLHGYLLSSSVLVAFFRGTPEKGMPAGALFGSLVSLNLMSLAIELFASYRLRKRVANEWGERRVHAREQLRMRDELQYARELQLSMLPDCAPRLPWADICSISIPATEVGGDYYDYFVERDRVVLVCGDVAGHGMAAGLVLASLRSGFTLLRDSLNDPAAVLRRLHDLVAQTSRRRMLVSVAVVLIEPDTHRATIASAGHPPVIVRRADGTVSTIDLFAPPLGVRLPVAIPQRTIDIAPGDVIVLHSDGIYETRSRSGEDYGLDRLTEVVRANGNGTAEEIRDAILANVAGFRGTPEAADDVTIVVCRIV